MGGFRARFDIIGTTLASVGIALMILCSLCCMGIGLLAMRGALEMKKVGIPTFIVMALGAKLLAVLGVFTLFLGIIALIAVLRHYRYPSETTTPGLAILLCSLVALVLFMIPLASGLYVFIVGVVGAILGAAGGLIVMSS